MKPSTQHVNIFGQERQQASRSRMARYDEGIDMRNQIARPSAPPSYDVPLHCQLATVQNANQARFIRSLNLCRETHRYQTFNSDWPLDSAPSGREMAASGWFYLGNLDRTQCFSCGGVLRNWRRLDNPNTEHISHFPHCSMAQGREIRNIPDTNRQSCLPSTTELNVLAEQQRITSRTRTEARSSSRYVRTRAKCFYCNGDLQNWRQYDNPRQEQAKRFPTCEFLLQRRGWDGIQPIHLRFPNINQLIFYDSEEETNQRSQLLEEEPNTSSSCLRKRGYVKSAQHHKQTSDRPEAAAACSATKYSRLSTSPLTNLEQTCKHVIGGEQCVHTHVREEPLMKTTAEPWSGERQSSTEVNHREGNHRPFSFLRFAPRVPINDEELSAAGFYYAGQNDHVWTNERPDTVRQTLTAGRPSLDAMDRSRTGLTFHPMLGRGHHIVQHLVYLVDPLPTRNFTRCSSCACCSHRLRHCHCNHSVTHCY